MKHGYTESDLLADIDRLYNDEAAHVGAAGLCVALAEAAGHWSADHLYRDLGHAVGRLYGIERARDAVRWYCSSRSAHSGEGEG